MDRNPSPAPELRENEEIFYGDNIGRTAFSKHWLFTTLTKVIKEVEKHEESEDESDLGIDVDEDLQNEMCKLWDMSADQEVSKFLDEYKAISVLIEVISKSKAPRVTEICIGILGNMACNSDICVRMTDNVELLNLVLLLLENTDPPTLVETTRMMYTCLSNEVARQPWVDLIALSQDIHEHIRFILTSSTNVDLLKNMGEFLDQLLDLEETMSSKWTTSEFIAGLIEAYSQLGNPFSDSHETYLHIFQLFSTTEKGVAALLSNEESLTELLMAFLTKVCDDDIVGVEDHGKGLTSAISVLNVLFASSDDVSDRLLKDEQLLRILLKVLEPVYKPDNKGGGTNEEKSIFVKSSTNQTTDDSDSDHNDESHVNNGHIDSSSSVKPDDFMSLFQDTFHEMGSLMSSINELLLEIFAAIYRKTQSQESQHEVYLPLLTYLDSSCSRNRISILINSLRKSATKDDNPVSIIKDVSLKLKMERLARIIDDILAGRTVSRSVSGSSQGSAS